MSKLGKLASALLTGGVIVTCSLVSAQSAHASTPATSPSVVAAWQAAIGQVSSPGRGCFRASYPNSSGKPPPVKTSPIGRWRPRRRPAG
jgi:hypothetical protein